LGEQEKQFEILNFGFQMKIKTGAEGAA